MTYIIVDHNGYMGCEVTHIECIYLPSKCKRLRSERVCLFISELQVLLWEKKGTSAIVAQVSCCK